MTAKELQTKLNKLLEVDPEAGDLICFISTQGMCYSGVEIKDVGPGIDWTDGKLLFGTDIILSTLNNQKYEKYREFYLKKNSNWTKVYHGNELTAEFKKEKKEFKDKIEAIRWLIQKAEGNI